MDMPESIFLCKILLYLEKTSIGTVNLGNDGLLVREKFNPNSKTLFCWAVKFWEERLTIKLTEECLMIFWDGFCFFNRVEIFFIQITLMSKIKVLKQI